MQITQHSVIIGFLAILLLGGAGLFSLRNPSTSDFVALQATSTPSLIQSNGEGGGTATSSSLVPQSPPPPPRPTPPAAPHSAMYKELVRPTGFLNTYTLNLPDRNTFQLKDFIGKQVILLHFWTSSSPNALRMFPYLVSWQSKYKDKGLLVISVHTPRFAYERTQDVVSASAFAWNVIHPIVLDNNFETWSAYQNTVWPTTYLIDINGRIAATYVGEGSYEPMEAKIQQLLVARSEQLGILKNIYMPFATPKDAVPVDLTQSRSPEAYFGAARNTLLANGSALIEGIQDLEMPSGQLVARKLYLGGSWNISRESARNLVSGARVRYHYEGKYIHAVMGGNGSLKVRVLRDGSPLPEHAAGKDVRYEKGESVIYINGGTRVYEVVADGSGYGTHTIELVFEHSGIEIYTLTFS